MAGQRTDEVSSLFSSFPSSGRPSKEEFFDDDASYSTGSDNEVVSVYHAPTTDNSSWNFEPVEDSEEMRRLRSESAAQRQKAAAAEKQTREAKVTPSTRAKGKAKAIVESEEEEEEMSVSEEEDLDGDEEGDVDVDGELSEDETKSNLVAEADSEDDDDVSRSPLKPRLKIKLKLPIVPASSTSNTATPVPEEQKLTPGRRAVAKRSAAVRGRRRIQDIESSPSEIESEDGESEVVEDEEDEEDEDIQVSVNNNSATARTAQTGSRSRSMTTRQAVLASVMDSSHIALDSDLAAQSVQGNSSKKKKILNETELALRREENARKRKNLSEKRLEDEKLETINRLLKKQTRPRTKRTGGPSQAHSAGSSVPPAPTTTTASTGNRGGKRGGARKGGRGRGGPRRRPSAADEEGGEGEGEADGDGMEVDVQEGEGEEAVEGENEVGGEEGDVPDGSIGGSDRSKTTQGPAVPMFRWVSTSILVAAAGSEVSHTAQLAAKSIPQDQPGGNAENVGDGPQGDVDMADASNVALPKADTGDDKPTDSISTVIACSNDDVAATVTAAPGRQMQFYLAIPVAFLPPESENIPTPPPSPESRTPAMCAVSGCGESRKYRLVKDWKIGACGMAHLKVLEGMT